MQLAEPLPRGEPVLKVRREFPYAEAERAHAPVIKDRFVLAENSSARSSPPSLGTRSELTPGGQELPLPRSSSVVGNRPVVAGNAQKPSQIPTFKMLAESAEASQEHVSAHRPRRSAAAVRGPSAADKAESVVSAQEPLAVRTADVTPRRQQKAGQDKAPIPAAGPRLRSERAPVPDRTWKSAPTPFAAESRLVSPSRVAEELTGGIVADGPKAAKDEPARQDQARDSSAGKGIAPDPPKTVLPPPAKAIESKASEGPRVHIGTVEIRAVLPQPAAMQPAVVVAGQTAESRAAQSRTRPRDEGQLARGLAWHYGLVQG